MMKRPWILAAIVILPLALGACGGTPAATQTATETEAAAQDTTPMQAALSPTAQNLLGILKLEGTDLAVNPEQAATMLPLWQAYRSLLGSDTAATAELEALQAQIGQALTEAQAEAIAAMDLGPDDVAGLMQELGLTPAGAEAGGTDTTRPSMQGMGPGGGAGGGMGPGGGMAPPEGGFVIQGEGMPGGGELDPQARATMQAGRPADGQRDRFSLMLLDPLIELLKERAAS